MCGRRTTGTIKCPRCRCPPKAEMAWLLSLFSLSSSGANQSSPGHQILTPPMAHRENKIIAVAHRERETPNSRNWVDMKIS